MKYVLISKRSHADKNPRINYKEDILNRYNLNDSSLFVSFRDSPQMLYRFKSQANDTPMGIYTFPLKKIFDDEYMSGIANDLTTLPYLHLIKRKTLNILNVSKDIPDFDKKFEKLKKIAKDKNNEYIYKNLQYIYLNLNTINLVDFEPSTRSVINTLNTDATLKRYKSGAKLYLIAVWVAYELANKRYRLFPIELTKLLLRLGYNCVQDDGDSIIHYREPEQTVFLISKAIKVLRVYEIGTFGITINSWFDAISFTLHDQSGKRDKMRFSVLLDTLKYVLNMEDKIVNKNCTFGLKQNDLSNDDMSNIKHIFTTYSFYKDLKNTTFKSFSLSYLNVFYDKFDKKFIIDIIEPVMKRLFAIKYTKEEAKVMTPQERYDKSIEEFVKESKKYSIYFSNAIIAFIKNNLDAEKCWGGPLAIDNPFDNDFWSVE